MEAVSIAAGEGFTDFPECTDRVIAKCAQVLNDKMPEKLRNKLLKPLILDSKFQDLLFLQQYLIIWAIPALIYPDFIISVCSNSFFN